MSLRFMFVPLRKNSTAIGVPEDHQALRGAERIENKSGTFNLI